MSDSVKGNPAANRIIPFPKSKTAKPLRNETAYRLKITLNGSHPPIWRRVLVPSGITFYRLHRIIQTLFDWQECHLFEFSFSGTAVSLPREDDFSLPGSKPSKNAKRVKIDRLLSEEPRFLYTYDFGDNWEHTVELEAVLEREPEAVYPICTAGERHAPLEDIGGMGGYENFLKAISDPQDPMHEDMLEWSGGTENDPGFDPEEFDIDQINGMLGDL